MFNPRKSAVQIDIGFLDKSKRNETTFNWGPGMSTSFFFLAMTFTFTFSKKLLLFIFKDYQNHV